MATPAQRAAPGQAPFVGRQAELEALERAFEDVRSGQPRVVVIEGSAGIGKTALVERFIAGKGDARVLRASGDQFERDLPFGVLDQMLRRAGEPSPGGGDDHVTIGSRLLATLGAWQDEHPVVVFVDDVHWADTPSLRALLFVVRRLVADRVLVVLASRDPPGALPEGLSKAAADGGGHHLRLRPFGTDQLRDLASARGVRLSSRALRRLEEHARGNPLYTCTLLDELPTDAWHRPDSLPAPRSFAAIVERRVEACSDEVRRLLEAVAVLGPHAPLATAAALADVESPLDVLEAAVDAGLLRSDEAAGMPLPSFAHPLMAAAVYDGLGPARRAALHRRAADLVEQEGSKLHHLAAAAAGPDGALAAQLDGFAQREAARHSFELAAKAMVSASRLSANRAEREGRLLRAVDWMLAAGDAAQARVFAADIADCADGPRRSAILGQLAELDGNLDEAERLLRAAWDQRDESDAGMAAVIAHRNAYHSLRQMQDEEVVAWAARALELAPDDPLAPGWTGTLALSLWRLGRGDEAFAALERASSGDEDADLHLRGMRGWLRFAGDDLAGGRADLEAAVAGELRHGALLVSSVYLTMLSHTQFAMGDWPDAVVAAEQALALAAETEHPHTAFAWWAAIAVPAARGDRAATEVFARRAAAEPLDAPDRSVALGMSLALAAAARGESGDVLKALEPVAAMSPNPALDEPGFWSWQDVYADALVAVGRIADADRFLQRHEALADARKRSSMIARLARVRGRVEAAKGRREPATAAFVSALEHIEPLGMPYEEALIRLAYGQFLRRDRRRRAASDELSRARETLQRLDARPALERCERELETCGLTPVKRKADERPDLTPQEQAVARLVATGRTNREVAAELLLSVKTVEVHLTRIYAKLGISSRAQLAANPYKGA